MIRPPLTYPLAVAWALSASAMLQLLLTASVVVRPKAAHDIVHLGAVEALVFMTAVLGIVWLHGGERPLKASLGLRPTHPTFLLLGVGLGFSLHWPAEAIAAIVDTVFPTPKGILEGRVALLSATSSWRVVLVLAVVACVGPLVEELFFRGALFGALRRGHSLFGAAALTGVCFVIGHLDLYLWPPLTVVAAALSHLRAMSGSLLPVLAAHVAFNAVTVLALVTGASPAAEPPRMDVGPMAAGFVVTLALVVGVQYAASRSQEARRGRAEDAE